MAILLVQSSQDMMRLSCKTERISKYEIIPFMIEKNIFTAGKSCPQLSPKDTIP
jgi:hypothetical protein